MRNLRRQTKYWEKKAWLKAPIYKGGIDTKIANKHFYEFTKDFVEKNAEALEEARLEMIAIKEKRRKEFLNGKAKKNFVKYKKIIPKADRDEYARQQNHIRNI